MRDYKRYPRRDPIKDYFPLPNEIFSLGLCDGEIAVYAYLLRCENRVTHQCYPSYNTIGNAVGLRKKQWRNVSRVWRRNASSEQSLPPSLQRTGNSVTEVCATPSDRSRKPSTTIIAKCCMSSTGSQRK